MPSLGTISGLGVGSNLTCKAPWTNYARSTMPP